MCVIQIVQIHGNIKFSQIWASSPKTLWDLMTSGTSVTGYHNDDIGASNQDQNFT